jgi:hypothetical protein
MAENHWISEDSCSGRIQKADDIPEAEHWAMTQKVTPLTPHMRMRFFHSHAILACWWGSPMPMRTESKTKIRERWSRSRTMEKNWIRDEADDVPEAEEWGRRRKWLCWPRHVRMRFSHSYAILLCSWRSPALLGFCARSWGLARTHEVQRMLMKFVLGIGMWIRYPDPTCEMLSTAPQMTMNVNQKMSSEPFSKQNWRGGRSWLVLCLIIFLAWLGHVWRC